VRLAVVGTGYVGLVAGTCLADCGNNVICVDVDEVKIAALRKGEIPIYEPGLKELVHRNQEEGRLVFSTDLPGAVEDSDIIFIAVGTPPAEDGSADLKHVLGVAAEIGQVVKSRKLVVIKSTVPPGTALKVKETLRGAGGEECAVISNPEFMKEGAAVDDFARPDRVVIGGSEDWAINIMKDLYEPYVRTGNPILVMDNTSAEMTKYASNAMLAARISLMNEIANLCDRTGADVNLVREGIGLDQRIGNHFLFPGVGYGGSCFPKDVQALARTGRDHGYAMSILDAVEEVNNRQKRVLFDKVAEYYNNDLKGKKIGVWGLAFKPKTDDMREAPAVVLIKLLLEAGCSVSAYDPEAMTTAKNLFGDQINYSEGNYEACEKAHALLVVTEWNEFRRPDFERIKASMARPVIFDGRNLYDPDRLREMEITYVSIGRPEVHPS